MLLEERGISNGEEPPKISNSNIGWNVGCTANVVLITPTQIFIANAGDSRSVLSRKGKAIALSTDHKPENTN